MTGNNEYTKTGLNKGRVKRKIIQSLSQQSFDHLKELADKRGITVQTLIRSVIIPEWLKDNSLPK